MAILEELTTEFKEIDFQFQEIDMPFTPLGMDYQPLHLEYKPVDTKVDWMEVHKHYLTHPTSSYADLSKKFGVSLKQVKKHGSRDGYARGRQRVSDLTASAIEESLADERVAANERHIEGYQQAQALAITYLEIMTAQMEAAKQKAEAEGRLPNDKELPSPTNLLALTKAFITAVNGERVCLGLPTAVEPAPRGWKLPSHEDTPSQSLEELLATLKNS